MAITSKALRKSAVLAISMLSPMVFAAEASAQTAKPAEARNVVLVHGAWADGSSWAEVIARLEEAGLHVTAVQNPLTSLADSAAATRRALALQDGPTVLVAHSWGGTVISETGMDPKVTALVYVAARAPDAGEDFVALSGKFPTMPVRAGVQERDGFTNLSEEAFLKYLRTVSLTKRQKSFMPSKSLPPPLCSVGEPPWLLGAQNRAGMRFRNSIRRFRLTWNDFWQHA